MKVIIGTNLTTFTKPGSMGVVNDTRYVRCYWPSLDNPVALFAEGSSGIEVQGPPTPRNVVFPEGTVFLPILVNRSDWKNPTWDASQAASRRAPLAYLYKSANCFNVSGGVGGTNLLGMAVGATDITTDPLFVDPSAASGSRNFGLQSGSPAKGTGA